MNDRNERVRAEFAALLVRIKSIRNLHFYDVVPVDDLLARLVLDKDCLLVRKQLVSLFLNSYFPQSVGGSSQVARCLALVKKSPEAAMVFYGSVADHASVGSVCKLSALLLRCSLNFVSKRLKKHAGNDNDSDNDSDKAGNDDSDNDNDDDDDDDDSGFSVVGQIVVLEVIASLLSSVHRKVMTDPRYAECKAFVAEQLPVASIEALLRAYSAADERPLDQEALSAVWKVVGLLGELSEGPLMERLVARLLAMDESSSKRLFESMVLCLAKWEQLPFFVSKLVRFLHQWKEHATVADSTTTHAAAKKKTKTNNKGTHESLNPIVVLGAVEFLVQSPAVRCPKPLVDQLLSALQRCVAPVLDLDAVQFLALYKANAFRILRLLEVFARFTVLAESASVVDRAAALSDKSAVKRAELASLQPSALFTPPEALAALSQWVTRLLPAFRDLVYDANMASLGTKRCRGKAGDEELLLSPLEQLLSRWRNLFSLLGVLSAECVAFALENETASSDGAAAEFTEGCVDDFVEALDGARHFERVVFYQACQLLYLLTTVTHRKTAAIKAKEPTQERRLLLAALDRWTTKLREALERAHAKHEEKATDLWLALAPTIEATAPQSVA